MKVFVVMLRCPSLHPRTLLRYQVTSELLQQNIISYGVMEAQGKGQLSQMMSLVVLGDWVSYYLAMLYGADPTPVKSIDYLKKRLSEAKFKLVPRIEAVNSQLEAKSFLGVGRSNKMTNCLIFVALLRAMFFLTNLSIRFSSIIKYEAL